MQRKPANGLIAYTWCAECGKAQTTVIIEWPWSSIYVRLIKND
jgi:hypothetical protein